MRNLRANSRVCRRRDGLLQPLCKECFRLWLVRGIARRKERLLPATQIYVSMREPWDVEMVGKDAVGEERTGMGYPRHRAGTQNSRSWREALGARLRGGEKKGISMHEYT